MKELLEFLIKKITGSEDFVIEESQDERGLVFNVKADQKIIGLIIGKAGKTIKNIRRIASIKATLENKSFSIVVNEK